MTNPLAKHFRHAAIHIKLPSKNKYWNESDIEMPMSGELPVYPMTVNDEITLRTPDGLLNGDAVMNLIKSCIPNIKNPWNAPATDIDALLIGIRMASYGNDMDISVSCPECKKDSDFCLELPTVLAGLKTANFDKEIEMDSLKFKFKPQTYSQSNKEDKIEFEQRRMINAITNAELPDDRKKELFDESFKALRNLIVENIVDHVSYIETPDGERVMNRTHIHEYFMNASREVYNSVKDHITHLNDSSKIKPLKVSCSHCEHQFETKMIFDYSRFFG
jgi:hypothetical protein